MLFIDKQINTENNENPTIVTAPNEKLTEEEEKLLNFRLNEE